MKTIIMEHSKYRIEYPEDQVSGVRVIRHTDGEDITEHVMNNPFFDLLLEYIDTKEELDKLKAPISYDTDKSVMVDTVIGSLPVSIESMLKLNKQIIKVSGED